MKAVAPMEVGLVVVDLDRALPFYRDVLGLSVLTDIEVPPPASRAAGLAPDGYRVVRLETNRGDRVKLAQPRGACAPAGATRHAMHRGGAAYVTFIVDDLPQLHDRLTAAGVAIASDGVVELRPGVTMLLATDPEHNWIEFVHYDDLGSYRPQGART